MAIHSTHRSQQFRILGFLALLLAPFLPGCQHKTVQTAFYHWEQSLELAPSELELLTETQTSDLYLRIFDIDYKDKSQAPGFLSTLSVQEIPPAHLNIIPCIYITNRSFKNVDYILTDSLAKRTATTVRHLQKKSGLAFGKEIQLDCDWTPGTRKHYFAFLKQLRSYLPQFEVLSATIRLHQFKYPGKTGIPPVDRGSLMVYNMGDFKDPEAKNAIYDNDILKQYLNVKDAYPLPLDVAMPTFNWALVFRFGKAVKIIHHPRVEELQAQPDQFAPLADRRFKVLKNGYWQGLYLYKGDVLRIDRIAPVELAEGLQLIRRNGLIQPDKIIYYHLSENITQLYTYEDFKSFTTGFH
ncbi:MAG: hypothetical protein JEZ14_24315 [Marinilabiliaceae bacterium]|nr:hypothetical protein [Marinilabiliaceae bacterium]